MTSPRRWSAVANVGSIGRRGPTSNKFGRGEGTFGGTWMGEARISFSAITPSRTRCVATAYSSGQSDGQITKWSVVVSAFHGNANKPGDPV